MNDSVDRIDQAAIEKLDGQPRAVAADRYSTGSEFVVDGGLTSQV